MQQIDLGKTVNFPESSAYSYNCIPYIECVFIITLHIIDELAEITIYAHAVE